MKRFVIVLSHQKFNNFEFSTVRKGLYEADYDVKIATASGENATGYLVKTPHGSQPLTVVPDFSIREIQVAQIGGIILIGGSGVKRNLWHNPELHNLLWEAYDNHKLIGAICLAPVCLVYAGIITSGKLTAYKTNETLRIIRDHGLTYHPGPVHTRGNIITANGPKASEVFTAALIQSMQVD